MTLERLNRPLELQANVQRAYATRLYLVPGHRLDKRDLEELAHHRAIQVYRKPQKEAFGL